MRVGSWILWFLVSGSISSGLVPRVEASGRPSGHVLVRLRPSSSGAPSWGRPQPSGTLPASRRPCAPTPSKTAKGALSRPSPPQALTPGRVVPRRPTSLGHELLSPLLSLDPAQAGGASVSPKWGYSQHSGPGVS